MVENPARITHLVASWFREGLCEEAIFNLKLPMKKRYAVVEHNLEVLRITSYNVCYTKLLRCSCSYSA